MMRRVNVYDHAYRGEGDFKKQLRGEAVFHEWGLSAKATVSERNGLMTAANTVAIIEWPDGSVELVAPTSIKFIDPERVTARSQPE